jgi:hypothetical protein
MSKGSGQNRQRKERDHSEEKRKEEQWKRKTEDFEWDESWCLFQELVGSPDAVGSA